MKHFAIQALIQNNFPGGERPTLIFDKQKEL